MILCFIVTKIPVVIKQLAVITGKNLQKTKLFKNIAHIVPDDRLNSGLEIWRKEITNIPLSYSAKFRYLVLRGRGTRM